MKSRSRIRRRPGDLLLARSIGEKERKPKTNQTISIGTTQPLCPSPSATSCCLGRKRRRSDHLHGVLGHNPLLIRGYMVPQESRRRKRAHLVLETNNSREQERNDDDKSFSPSRTRRRRRRSRTQYQHHLATALTAALVVLIATFSSSILASAAEIVSGDAEQISKAGNLRRNPEHRRLSRIFTDGQTSDGLDFDLSFLDAPMPDNGDDEDEDEYYRPPELITEMGRPPDDESSSIGSESNPTLAALLDADNHHPTGTSSSTPLTSALTYSSTPDARIVGGTVTPSPPNLRYPYVASLQRSNYPVCGAFLIAPDCILTAAHCRGSFDYAELGRWDLAAENTESYQRFNIVTCTMHPSFTYFVDRKIDFDFMVCKLSGAADVTKYPPVRINRDPSVPDTAQPVTVVGWGRTAYMYGGARSSQQLQATVNVVSEGQCRQAQGCIGPGQCYSYRSIIKSSMICAQANGRDSCQG